MAEWTWLFQWFPIADTELVSDPLPPQVANVLVRTVRKRMDEAGAAVYDVRVAPHNVAGFRGGPWIRTFTEEALRDPGIDIEEFRSYLWEQVLLAKGEKRSL